MTILHSAVFAFGFVFRILHVSFAGVLLTARPVPVPVPVAVPAPVASLRPIHPYCIPNTNCRLDSTRVGGPVEFWPRAAAIALMSFVVPWICCFLCCRCCCLLLLLLPLLYVLEWYLTLSAWVHVAVFAADNSSRVKQASRNQDPGRGQGHADICTLPFQAAWHVPFGQDLFFSFFCLFCVVLGPSAFPSVAIFFAWTEAAYLWLCFLTFLPIVCFWFDCWQCSVLTFNEMSTKDAAYMSVCLSVLLSVRFTSNRRLSWHFPASFSVWLNALSPIPRNELPAAFLG